MATTFDEDRHEAGASGSVAGLKGRAEELGVALFWWLCGRLSIERAGALGRWLLTRLGPLSDRDATVRRNLEIAFPDLSPSAIRDLARQVWSNAGTVVGEYPHLRAICDPDSSRIEVVLDPACDRSRPIVFCTPHLASWEVSAVGPMRMGWPMTVVYSPLPNPALDQKLRDHRTAGLKVRLLPREGSGLGLLRALKRGEAVGLVADRREKGEARIHFFGVERPISLAPAKLALRGDAQFASAVVERAGAGRYRIRLDAPIECDDTTASIDERATALMVKLYARYEDYIRAQPGNWFCMKLAWPKPMIAEVLHGRSSGPAVGESSPPP